MAIYQKKKWRRENPDFDRLRYWANKDTERERHLIRKYGVTLTEYARLLDLQGGKCAICERTETSKRMFDVDHDHITRAVRGLLCSSCNRVLGHAHDSAERLRKAADYLDSRKSPNGSEGKS